MAYCCTGGSRSVTELAGLMSQNFVLLIYQNTCPHRLCFRRFNIFQFFDMMHSTRSYFESTNDAFRKAQYYSEKNCWSNSRWKKQSCVCMSLDLKALASWQHFTIALHVHTHVLWRYWGALSQLTVMAHNSLMPYSCKWERILMWTTLVFPPNLFCLWRETFCWNNPMGEHREVERGFVLMGVFIILDDFYHSTFRMRNS